MSDHAQANDARAPGSIRLRPTALQASVVDLPTSDLCWELVRRLRADQRSLLDPQSQGKLLGLLHAELDRHVDHHTNRYSRSNSLRFIFMLRRVPGWNDQLLQGATVVEFGCGALNPLGGLWPLLALGAKTAIGFDLEAIEDESIAARAMYRLAAEMIVAPKSYFAHFAPSSATLLANLSRCDLTALHRGEWTGLDPASIRFERKSASATELATASVDLMTSISFLEHVTDVDAVIAEFARVAKPGALSVHSIDGCDHSSYADAQMHPLQFLTEAPGSSFVRNCNRIRPLDYRAIFERHGFDVLDLTPNRRVPVDETLRSTFVEPFRSMAIENLEVLGAQISARRR